MSAIVTYGEAKKLASPEDWQKFLDAKNPKGMPYRWQLEVNGQPLPLGTDWAVTSPFGTVCSAVALKSDGKTIDFDRPLYVESDFIQAIGFAIDDDGDCRIAMVEQLRPHADDPDEGDADGHPPVLFRHCVMGFNDSKVKGMFESAAQAAARELGEEVGAFQPIGQEMAPFGHNPSPSFTAKWGDVGFFQYDWADILKLKKPEQSPDEEIMGRYWPKLQDLLGQIASGKSETGAYVNVSTSNSALLMFLAAHPEIAARAFAKME